MQHRRETISRRQALGLLGLGGATMAAALSGLGGLLWLAAQKRDEENAEAIVRYVTATPGDAVSATPGDAVSAAPGDALAPQPEIVSRSAWGALAPNHDAANENGFYDAYSNPGGWMQYPMALEAVYYGAVMHHSVIDEGSDAATLAEIQRLHREERGWADVAYHYFIGKSGVIYAGRTLAARGAHAYGHNTGTVGICLLGDFTREQPRAAALAAATALVRWLAGMLRLETLAAHNQLNTATACPGTYLLPYLPGLARDTGLTYGRQQATTGDASCPCCV